MWTYVFQCMSDAEQAFLRTHWFQVRHCPLRLPWPDTKGVQEETFMKNRMWAKGETRKMWICSWGSPHIFCNFLQYVLVLGFGLLHFDFWGQWFSVFSLFQRGKSLFFAWIARPTVTVLTVQFWKIWAPIRCHTSQKALLAPRFGELPSTKVCFPSWAALTSHTGFVYMWLNYIKFVYHGFT